MKPLANKNEAIRIYVLAAGLVVIVVLLFVQVQNFNAPQSSPSLSASSNTGGLVANKPAKGEFESIVPPADPGKPNPDPFKPVLNSKQVTEPEATVEKLAPVSEISGSKSSPAPAESTQPVPERPAMPKLTGVLLGDKPLAVFEIAGESQMASLGETLPGGYRVIAITERSVQLARGKEVVTLTLGE
jgi:hypothetical protein